MLARHPRTCAHPALKGRTGTCPDCRKWTGVRQLHAAIAAPAREFTATERAVQRAVQVLSQWASTGITPP
jgi:hypothetical protein